MLLLVDFRVLDLAPVVGASHGAKDAIFLVALELLLGCERLGAMESLLVVEVLEEVVADDLAAVEGPEGVELHLLDEVVDLLVTGVGEEPAGDATDEAAAGGGEVVEEVGEDVEGVVEVGEGGLLGGVHGEGGE